MLAFLRDRERHKNCSSNDNGWRYTMTSYEVAAEFDASGLRCPMPILKTKKEVQQIEVGQILKVIATDIGTKKDFPAWAERSGNEILEMVEEGDKIIWFIRRVK